jgi:hypothetical protein
MMKDYQLKVQYLFPFEDSREFEEFIEDYFNALDKTVSYSLFGRQGQSQFGLDVLSSEKKTVIQCKLKDISRADKKIVKELLKELHDDFAEFEKYNKTVDCLFRKFYFASSFKDDTNIQSAILKLNKDVNVEYWSWSRINRQMPSEIRDKYYDKFNEKNQQYYKQKEFILKKIEDIVSNEAHILCQLEQFFNIVCTEIKFVPIHHLIQYRPLNVNGGSYYRNYTLNSDNDELANFFNSFEIIDPNEVSIKNPDYFDGVENVKEKLTTVLKHLTLNLVYYVEINRQVFDIRLFHNEKCQCDRCQIEKFNFLQVDFNKEVKDTPIENLMSQAYARYKVGHFISAYHLFNEVVVLSKNEGKKLTTYMANVNLNHLATLIDINYYNDENSRKVVEELREIDFSTEICTINDEFDKEIVEWMNRDYYMKLFYTKINELKDKLVDHYYISLNGGFGNNNYVNELANTFAQMDQYLQQNMVINDCYKSYLDMVDMFIEGLFASYAIQNKKSSKINEFNDWILEIILKYGRPKTIRKLATRYKINSFDYCDEKNDDNIKELIIRLFQDFEESYAYISNLGNKEPNHNYFRDNYSRWQNNGIQLMRLVNFDDNFIQRFTTIFISKYQTQSLLIDPFEIISFFATKSSSLKREHLGELLGMGLYKKQLQRSNYWCHFAEICNKKNTYFEFSEDDLNVILNFEMDNSSEAEILIEIYRCMSDFNQKEKIKLKIEELLNESFSFELWNKAVVYDLINFESKYLEQAIDQVLPKDYSKSIIKPVFLKETLANNHQLNDFLNLCFKNEVDLTQGKYEKIKEGQNVYYQWLFDLDRFNYEKFEIKWIKEYNTVFYYKWYGKSNTLKSHIEELLKVESVENVKFLSTFFIDVFVVGR